MLSDYPAEAKLRALGLDGTVLAGAVHDRSRRSARSSRTRAASCARARCGSSTPRDVLMVGDRVDVDAAGAAAAGMPCVIIGAASDRPARARPTRCFPHSKGCVVSLTIAEGRASAGIWPYIQIARVDHWFKNAFMLLGVILAVFYQPEVARVVERRAARHRGARDVSRRVEQLRAQRAARRRRAIGCTRRRSIVPSPSGLVKPRDRVRRVAAAGRRRLRARARR